MGGASLENKEKSKNMLFKRILMNLLNADTERVLSYFFATTSQIIKENHVLAFFTNLLVNGDFDKNQTNLICYLLNMEVTELSDKQYTVYMLFNHYKEYTLNQKSILRGIISLELAEKEMDELDFVKTIYEISLVNPERITFLKQMMDSFQEEKKKINSDCIPNLTGPIKKISQKMQDKWLNVLLNHIHSQYEFEIISILVMYTPSGFKTLVMITVGFMLGGLDKCDLASGQAVVDWGEECIEKYNKNLF